MQIIKEDELMKIEVEKAKESFNLLPLNN